MAELSAEQLVQKAFELNLLDVRQVETLWAEFGTREVPFAEIRNHLVRRNLVTNFQIERLLKGEKAGYFYGDYKVLYLVGSGSFARVFRAVHKDTGQVVAVKVLRKRFSDPTQNPDAQKTLDQFMREGKMGVLLRHPNIVQIHEVQRVGNSSFLVMDFVEGQSLRDFVKTRKKVAPEEATRLITDVVNGLAYASAKGVTHRDLKMSNVLVSSGGKALLVDFGLAAVSGKMSDEAMASCVNPRTIDYAALERATGVRKDDPRSDIYFVGCIYYHMLTGQAPLYESKDRIQRLSIQRFQEIPSITQVEPELPQVVAFVVNKAMELNPSRRYSSPGEMLADLKALGRRLTAGEVPSENVEFTLNQPQQLVSREGVSRTILLVESHTELQNLLRDGLKKHGYRVLVISDPDRAVQRFDGQQKVADLVVFSAVQLGEKSIEAYRQFCEQPLTRELPSILLLNERQQEYKAQIPAHDRRQVLTMPISLGQFRRSLNELLDAEEATGTV